MLFWNVYEYLRFPTGFKNLVLFNDFKEENSISQKAVGSLNEIETSSINKQKTKKPEKYHNRSKPSQLNPRWNFNKIQSQSNDEQSSSSISKSKSNTF